MKKLIYLILLSGLTVHCGRSESGSDLGSLTADSYNGNKFYFGWGAAANGDPDMMHNEVKYDVNHTHDIFTEEVGGNYLGKTLIGPEVDRGDIETEWRGLKESISADDMYVQYSSGHGYEGGLGVGVSYDDMRDFALSTRAKEVIVFTMACYSGNLVDSFDEQKSTWQNWQDEGRTLFVMASSASDELSSTGPGQSDDEEGGPNGSAGSAFGFALWQALLGRADGFIDGIRDNYLSLEEIKAFTAAKTLEVGGHRPKMTGVYNPNLIMNRVPSRSYVENFIPADVVDDIETLRSYINEGGNETEI